MFVEIPYQGGQMNKNFLAKEITEILWELGSLGNHLERYLGGNEICEFEELLNRICLESEMLTDALRAYEDQDV